MTDSHCEAVALPPLGSTKAAVALPAERCHLDVIADARLHDLKADEALDVGAELREVLGARRRVGRAPARGRRRTAAGSD